MRSRTWWRIGQWLVGGAIVVAAAMQLGRNWDALRQQPLEWKVRPAYLVAAVVLTWLMYAGLIQAWRAILKSWGGSIGTYTAARIWTVSSLGKYLPGKVWAIAGMAVMAQRAGVPPWVAMGAAVLLQALSIAAGAAVISVTGLTALEASYPWLRPALIGIAVAGVIGAGLLLWRPFMSRLLRLAGVAPETRTSPTAATLLGAFAINVVAWVGYGGAFWLLARGTLPDVDLDLTTAVGAFAASYLAGFLALVAPGGLLVREGTLILMLQGTIGPGAAAALAIASRIMLTFTEFGAAVPFVVRPGDSTRVINSRTGSHPR